MGSRSLDITQQNKTKVIIPPKMNGVGIARVCSASVTKERLRVTLDNASITRPRLSNVVAKSE